VLPLNDLLAYLLTYLLTYLLYLLYLLLLLYLLQFGGRRIAKLCCTERPARTFLRSVFFHPQTRRPQGLPGQEIRRIIII